MQGKETAILSVKPLNSFPVAIQQFGTVPYAEALCLQQEAIAGREKKTMPDTLILLEHPPTYTLGLRGKDSHFRVPVNLLCQKGIAVFRVDRGGDVTFHGPGQLVGYPIIDIVARGGDIRQHVRQLEDMIIAVLAEFYINARHLPGYPGVWAGGKKIAAIGIKVNSAGIASHGFALNVNTDLAYFENIIPCGLEDKSITSMAEILKRPVQMEQVRTLVSETFMRVFG